MEKIPYRERKVPDMNEVMKNLLTRRSVRAFRPDQVRDEDLEQILQAGLYAPSAMNRQSWQFTVVQGEDSRRKLTEAMQKALNNPGYNFYQPPTLILVSNVRENSNAFADTGCAMENMFLAAHSLGLATVWINQLKDTCDLPEVRKVLDGFGIPANHIVCATVALGYAKDALPEPKERTGVVKYVR